MYVCVFCGLPLQEVTATRKARQRIFNDIFPFLSMRIKHAAHAARTYNSYTHVMKGIMIIIHHRVYRAKAKARLNKVMYKSYHCPCLALPLHLVGRGRLVGAGISIVGRGVPRSTDWRLCVCVCCE